MEKLEDIEANLTGLNALLTMGILRWRQEAAEADQGNLSPGERKKLREKAQWNEIRANQGHRAELLSVLDTLCNMYLNGTPAQCERIRNIVVDKREVLAALNSYIYRALEKFEATNDVQWLNLGLASVGIEDLQFDYRDTLVALGELFLAATRAGINPLPLFQKVAATSSSKVTIAGMSTRDLLTNFDKTEYFIASIKPKLGKLPASH